jgi:hypothetical protein
MRLFHWLFGEKSEPRAPVALQHSVTTDVSGAYTAGPPVVVSPSVGPVFAADTDALSMPAAWVEAGIPVEPAFSTDVNTLPLTSAPLANSPDSAPEGAFGPIPDPVAMAAVLSMMHEAKELPIGSVRGHAVAHLKVDPWGCIFLNGKRVSLEEVKEELARLKGIGGVVFYYRDNPAEAPPPVSTALVAAVCEARLPLTFARRDYDPGVKVAEYLFPSGAW